MTKKTFWKPSILKIILFLVLFIISTLLSNKSNVCQPTSYGFPFKFFQFSECFDISPCIDKPEQRLHNTCEKWGFNNPEGFLSLIANILFWYLAASVIISISKKLSKSDRKRKS